MAATSAIDSKDSRPEKDQVKISEWKFESSSYKCSVCGTQRLKDGLEHDPRFWVQSAPFGELLGNSKECPWCEVLRTAVQVCTGEPDEALLETGYLDWGRDPFSPVWHAGGRTVDIEIFCTQGVLNPIWRDFF
jgi:hypothetical protein